MSWLIPLLALATLVRAEDASSSSSKTKNLVKAESFASVSAIKPGEPFKVGVRFKIEPKWHIYWINPGESGQATRVDWKFPEGFKVGKLEYPVPVNFPQPGDVKGYGYLNEVMLMATVTPPADLAPGTEVPYTTKADWLVCEDVCIPGKASFEGKLTVAHEATPANEDLFRGWTDKLPRWNMTELKALVLKTEAEHKDVEKGLVELAVQWRDQPPAGVEWFVGTPDSVIQKDLEATTDGSRSKLTFRPVPVPEEQVKVPVVVAYTDAAGKRQGVEFSFKLGKKQAAPKGQAAASRSDPQ
ncbi:MAG: protein-disulfide reductase DsbD domain-containing protein [Tepidisphaeraceae bacterium]